MSNPDLSEVSSQQTPVSWWSAFKHPAVLVSIPVCVTAIAAIGTSRSEGYQARQIQREQLEARLIERAMESAPDEAAVATNLLFLSRAGLIPTYEGAIADVIAEAEAIDQSDPPALPNEQTYGRSRASTTYATRLGRVFIAGVLANPIGEDAGNEQVVIANAMGDPVDLEGWTIKDRAGRTFTLGSTIVQPSAELAITIDSSLQLNNSGDTIALFDAGGDLMATFEYGRQDAREGVIIRLE